MVDRTAKRSTINEKIILVSTAALGVILANILYLTTCEEKIEQAEEETKIEIVTETKVEDSETSKKVSEVNLQPVVDSWLATTGHQDQIGIYFYDLENDEVIAKHNEDKSFALASIYKLFFVYKAYENIEKGISDGNAYFADGKTRLECLDKIIRESYNPCADVLRSEMLSDIDEIIEEEYKIDGTTNGGLYGSAEAVAKMLKIYYYHESLSDATAEIIKDTMLNQPETEYDWRMGFPSGFTVANVYDKVGWAYDQDEEKWKIFNDAAIVEFPEQDRHFVMVVLTGEISSRSISQLGTQVENAILEQI